MNYNYSHKVLQMLMTGMNVCNVNPLDLNACDLFLQLYKYITCKNI